MMGNIFKIFQKLKPEIGMPCDNCKDGKYIEIKEYNINKIRCANCGYEPPKIKPIKKK